jgi:hypothetical protein
MQVPQPILSFTPSITPTHSPLLSRRRYLSQTARYAATAGAATLAASFVWRSARAQSTPPLQLTPSQTEGPFYPDKMPRDTDFDLLTTQLYVAKDPGNQRDGLWQRLSADAKAALTMPFVQGSDGLQAKFAVVVV